MKHTGIISRSSCTRHISREIAKSLGLCTIQVEPLTIDICVIINPWSVKALWDKPWFANIYWRVSSMLEEIYLPVEAKNELEVRDVHIGNVILEAYAACATNGFSDLYGKISSYCDLVDEMKKCFYESVGDRFKLVSEEIGGERVEKYLENLMGKSVKISFVKWKELVKKGKVRYIVDKEENNPWTFSYTAIRT